MAAGKIFEIAFAINATMQQSLPASMKSASNVMRALAERTRTVNAEQKRLEQAWAQSQVQAKELAARLESLKQSFERGKLTASGYEAKSREISESMRAAGRSAEEYKGKLERLQAELQETKSKQERLRTAMANRQTASAEFATAKGNLTSSVINTAALVSPFVEMTREAVKFESAMADVRKVVDFDTPEQFKAMNKDILALTRSLPMAAADIAKIVAAGGQSGVAKSELLAFTESAAKMGVAFDVTAEQAGDMMAKWRTAFKMNQVQVVELADKINHLGNTTAASAPLISDVVTRVGPLGEVGGVASGEIAAIAASMVGVGVQSDVAATGIKNMILSLVAGGSATKSQAAAFQTLGMDAETMAKRMQTDARGAILDVFTAIQQLDADKQASVMQDLFGKESLAAISPMLSALDNLKANFAKVGDSAQYTGSMEAEFRARCETTENSLQLLKNAASETAINVGSIFLPTLNNAAKGVTEWAGNLSDYASKHPAVISAVMQLAGAMLALNIYLKATAVASKGVAVAQTVVRGVMAASNAATMIAAASGQKLSLVQKAMAGAQWVLNAAMAANPVGLVVAAIAALIGVGYLLVTNWESVKAFFVSLWESPLAAIIAFLNPITLLMYTGSLIIANWEAVKAWFVLLWNDPAAALEQFGAFVRSKIDALVNYVKQKWETLKTILSHPLDAVVNFIETGNVNGETATAAAAGASAAPAAPASLAAFNAASTVPVEQFGEAAAQSADKINQSADAISQFGATFTGNTQDLQACMQAMATSGKSAEELAQAAGPIATDFTQMSATMGTGNPLMQQQNGLLTASNPLLAQGNELTASGNAELSRFSEQLASAGQGASSAGEAGSMAASALNGVGTAANSVTSAFYHISAVAQSIQTAPASVASNAEGGIYRKGAFLTTFAEEGPEAAIPLDGSQRAISLWQQAGEMLGIGTPGQEGGSVSPAGLWNKASDLFGFDGGNGKAPAGGGTMTPAITINLTVNGNADPGTVKEAVLDAGRRVQQSFEEQMEAFQRRKARLAY